MVGAASDPTRVAMILGVPVDDVTMEEAVDRIAALVHDGRARGRTHQIATVNVDFVVNALDDADLLAVMRRTSMSIPDGMPIVWAARAMKTPLRTRVAGADLVPALVERAARDGLVVSLYGAGPGVAERAAALLAERYPGARVVGDGGPAFRDVADIDPADVAPLADLRPDICCVAFGNPKQERFIARFGASLGIPVMIGVGGTLDFLVGEKRRAPVWMQRTGLEWVHRAVTEPRRLARRYWTDAVVFVPGIIRQIRRGRGGDASVIVRDDGGEGVVEVGAADRVGNTGAAAIAAALRAAWREGRPVRVDVPAGTGTSGVPGLAEMLDLDRS